MTYELYKRNFKILKIDLSKSEAKKFIITEKGLIAPFVCLDGLGEKGLQRIIEERQKQPFSSIKDFKTRTKINKTVEEKMRKYGIFDNLTEDSKENNKVNQNKTKAKSLMDFM